MTAAPMIMLQSDLDSHWPSHERWRAPSILGLDEFRFWEALAALGFFHGGAGGEFILHLFDLILG